MSDIQIETVAQGVEYANKNRSTKNQLMWFRGHSKIIPGELTPRIFRDDICQSEEVEFVFTEEFRRRAPTILTGVLKRDDYLSWLVLMQHHGCPTRLLDWTKNFLIALYFVVSDKPDCDGELWAMDPSELNEIHKSQDLKGVATIDNCFVKYLVTQPMYRSNDEHQDKLKKRYRITDPLKYPVAFQAPLTFGRMNSQCSMFTIHPKPQKDYTIPEKMNGEDLVRYIIRSENKKSIRKDLYFLGIGRQALFQDLDSLSQDLLYEVNHVRGF